MRIQNARIYEENFRFATRELYTNGELIAAQSTDAQIVDAKGLMLIPGLVDIHTHGCVGYDFCDGTAEAFDAITAYEGKNGITSLTPASMSLPVPQLEQIYRAAGAYRYNTGAMLLGINMEGPFFCHGKKGAQNADFLSPPSIDDYNRLNDASGGMIKLTCIAPELLGAIDYMVQISPETTVSLAHTEADYDLAMSAFSHGASHVTHLFNAMLPFTHRAPGVVGAALDSGATVELICDGVHVHPAVVRGAFRMFGDDHMVLISDSMMATGMEDGSYSLGGQQVTVRGNRCTLSDGTIAGSTTNLFDCMRTAVKFGIPLESAIKMATFNPAKVIGETGRVGSLAHGRLANFVLMDDALTIHAVYVKGQKFA